MNIERMYYVYIGKYLMLSWEEISVNGYKMYKTSFHLINILNVH